MMQNFQKKWPKMGIQKQKEQILLKTKQQIYASKISTDLFPDLILLSHYL